MARINDQVRIYRLAVTKFGVERVAQFQGVKPATVRRYLNPDYFKYMKGIPQTAIDTAFSLLSQTTVPPQRRR